MKTTIEINDELLREAKARAQQDGRTLRDLVEEGLRSVVQAQERPRKKIRILVSRQKPGLTPEFENADWSKFKALGRER